MFKFKNSRYGFIFKIIAFSLIFVCLQFNIPLYAAITKVEDKPAWRAQIYIANQIRGIGLVDSYLPYPDYSYQESNPNISYVYDNSLAAMAYILTGNFGLAKEILDTLCNEVQKNISGVLYESYDFTNTYGTGSGTAFCGNSAWLLQTLNICQKITKPLIGINLYYATQKKLADYLLTLKTINGGLKGSSYDSWVSTEHNMIAYAALRNFAKLNIAVLTPTEYNNYITTAERIRTLLTGSSVWNGERFARGPNDWTMVTDVQALGVLLFGNTYKSALNWAEEFLRLTRTIEGTAIEVTGFDFSTQWLDTVWFEGTLQMALAFYKTGTASLYGTNYYDEAKKAIQPDGSVLSATNKGNATEYWELYPWRAIAPTAWLIFYCLKFNPFVLY